MKKSDFLYPPICLSVQNLLYLPPSVIVLLKVNKIHLIGEQEATDKI